MSYNRASVRFVKWTKDRIDYAALDLRRRAAKPVKALSNNGKVASIGTGASGIGV